MKKVVVFLWCLFVAAAAHAQQPQVTASVDKNQILIGEQFNLRVGIDMPANRYKLTWLDTLASTGKFVIASRDKIDSSYSTGRLNFEQTFHVTSFDSGSHYFPSLLFQFETLEGDSSFYMLTDSVQIEVRFSPDDNVLPFHDIKPIIKVPYERPWWFWLAIAWGAALLAFLIWLYIKRRRSKKSQNIFDAALSDFDEAMKLIKELNEENLPARGEHKLFYLRLTDIYKRYISRNSNRNMMHLTGAELIFDLSKKGIETQLVSDFSHTIRVADAVKFAKYIPGQQQSDDDLNCIATVIKRLDAQTKEGSHGV